jgi:thiamine-phosphate pyrophosphorylase
VQLYALCDQNLLDTRGLSLDDFINIAIDHGAKIIQYRNKTTDYEYIKKQLTKIKKLYSGKLIVNDAYKLSDFCDGVHLGQEDLYSIHNDTNKAIEIVRGSFSSKDKIIGISTHNEQEILKANKYDIDYIGLGAYRGTTTKKDIKSILGDDIDRLASLSIHKVGAIGGVRLEDRFENITYLVIGSGLIK